MDRHHIDYLQNRSAERRTSLAGTVVYGIILLYVAYQVLIYYDFAVLPPQELAWNALVYVLPKHLLLDRAKRQELKANNMLSQTQAAKSDALRKMLGIGGQTLLQKLPTEGIMRRAGGFTRQYNSDAPAGLGNWDNSCYQNSVLQGLASLDSLDPYLRQSNNLKGVEENTTTESLLETIGRLNNTSNNGKQLWTPAKLKNMSSWQQQDAQEYFSKIMEELEREAAKSMSTLSPRPGLESIAEHAALESKDTEVTTAEPSTATTANIDHRNPLDGLLAQRVACTRCGYSEGLSMIPFNCLTVPLGSSHFTYSLEECLDEYTKLEEVTDVECLKCTLLRAEQQLKQMLPSPPCYQSSDAESPATDKTVLKLPPELRAQAFKRLSAIQQALENDDFADKTVNETCQIPKKAHVSSTKTRQAVIGRAPQSLCVHVNRSVFDETTGVQRKNYASVRYPLTLDLGQWMLSDYLAGDDKRSGGLESILSSSSSSDGHDQPCVKYRIKAVVTHYGRHENGHYICYRQHPSSEPNAQDDAIEDGIETDDTPISQKTTGSQWWRLSDEDVSPVSEEDVLLQGGVFMLFYEREGDVERPAQIESPPIAVGEPQAAAQEQCMRPSYIQLEEEAGAIPLPDPSDLDSSNPEPPPETAPLTLSSTLESDTLDSPSPSNQTPTTPSTEAPTEDEFEPDADAYDEQQQLMHTPQTLQKPAAAAAPVLRMARDTTQKSRRGSAPFGAHAFRAVAAT